MASNQNSKGPGRPPLPAHERRNCLVTIRMTGQQRSELEADAEAAGLSLSEFLLTCWRELKGE